MPTKNGVADIPAAVPRFRIELHTATPLNMCIIATVDAMLPIIDLYGASIIEICSIFFFSWFYRCFVCMTASEYVL